MSAPKARNALVFLVQCVAFSTVEAFAAVQLHGWVAFGLWTIITLNLLRLVLGVYGLAQLAAKAVEADL